MAKLLKLESGDYGRRLDVVVAIRAKLSRSKAQQAIEGGQLKVNGLASKASYMVEVNDKLSLDQPKITSKSVVAPKLPILYQDDYLMIVNKPAGMLVHAAEGHKAEPTVADFAAQISRDTVSLRPGIVHRLDRETSGVLMIAKDSDSKQYLQDQLRLRQVEKTYLALVRGRLKESEAEISLPLARSTKQGLKRVVSPSGKSAITRYKVLAQYNQYSLVEALLVTGRTHQLRVHFSHLGHPIIGDKLYGEAKQPLDRLFLHAKRLQLKNPAGQSVTVEADLPPELKDFIDKLEKSV